MKLVMVTAAPSGFEVLPALKDLHHAIRTVDYEINALFAGSSFDVLLVDARWRASQNRAYLDTLRELELAVPVLAVFNPGGLVTLSRDWAIMDLIVDEASPAEVEARLRVAAERLESRRASRPVVHLHANSNGDHRVYLDESSSTCTIDGESIDLGYVEMRLLSMLTAHPDRAFSRDQLCNSAWQHSRRPPSAQSLTIAIRGLRSALGRHQTRLETVRGIGYRWRSRPMGSGSTSR